MPVYEFQLVGGTDILEKYFAVKDAPELGAVIHEGGKFYRRIISTPPQASVRNFEHVAHNLPRNCRGAPHYDSAGRPAFQSKREVTEFAKANGLHWD